MWWQEPTKAQINKSQVVRLIRTYAVELAGESLSLEDVKRLVDQMAGLRQHL